MATTPTFHIACNTCEVIGPTLVIGRALRGRNVAGAPRTGAAAGLAAWVQFMTGDTPDSYDPAPNRPGHATHDLRLLADGYDPLIPLPGWMPRPAHGPPDSGLLADQLIACPDCRAVHRNGDPQRRAVAYLTVDRGTGWFLFCRNCRNVWGQAAIDRIVRSELTQSDPDLWALQRQGIQEDRTLDN